MEKGGDATARLARKRGVVWVCDLAGSSSRLNAANEAELVAAENFLARFFWLVPHIARMAAGDAPSLFKWTGDGFLLWVETPLDRHRGPAARALYRAAFWLGIIIAVTDLGVSSEEPFYIRSGITYEPDGLPVERVDPDGHHAQDVIGRSVVLAFRLSGLKGPLAGVSCIHTQAELGAAAGDCELSFPPFKPTTAERSLYFKGETWGTENLCIGEQASADIGVPDFSASWMQPLVAALASGPDWARGCSMRLEEYRANRLAQVLKRVEMSEEKRAALRRIIRERGPEWSLQQLRRNAAATGQAAAADVLGTALRKLEELAASDKKPS